MHPRCADRQICKRNANNTGAKVKLESTLRDILQAAIRAPSADNHHRLQLEPTQEGVRLWSQAGRLASLTGYKRTLDLISLGAVIENIVLRASAHQLAATVTLFPVGQPDLVADIQLRPASTPADPLHNAIPLRHTNRRFFKGPLAEAAILQHIGEVTRQIPGCTLDWLDDAERRSRALKLIRLAEGERFRNPILHAELFEGVRFDIGWQQSCEEALPPGALEIEKPLRIFFKLMRHWSVMRTANLVGAYKQLAWRAGDLPCRFSPHLAVINAPSLSDQDQINAGRAFQRAWLAIAQHGLAMQPMPASVLYAQKAAVAQGIPGPLQARLSQGWAELQPSKTPLMVFRMGHAKPPSLVSGRQPLEYYLKAS
jgi:nitroreductase